VLKMRLGAACFAAVLTRVPIVYATTRAYTEFFLDEEVGASAHETDFNVNLWPAHHNLNVIYRSDNDDTLHLNFYFGEQNDGFVEIVYCRGESSLTPGFLSCPRGESILRFFLDKWTDSANDYPLSSFTWERWNATRKCADIACKTTEAKYWLFERVGRSGPISMRFFGYVVQSQEALSIDNENGGGTIKLKPHQVKFGLQLSGADVTTSSLKLSLSTILKGQVPVQKGSRLETVYDDIRLGLSWEPTVMCGATSAPVQMTSDDSKDNKVNQWVFPKPCGSRDQIMWWDPIVGVYTADDDDASVGASTTSAGDSVTTMPAADVVGGSTSVTASLMGTSGSSRRKRFAAMLLMFAFVHHS